MRLHAGRLPLAVVVLAVAGCSSSDGSGSDRELLPVRAFEIGMVHALAGHGDLVAAQVRDASLGYTAVLRVYREDPAFPGELLVLGDADLEVSNGVATDLGVSADRAAATFRDAGRVSVVALDGPSPVTVAVLERPDLRQAAASGRWLVLATAAPGGPSLELVDLEPTVPVSAATFAAGSPVTELLPFWAGFLVFTEGGYGVLQPDAGPASYTFTPHASIRGFERAQLSQADRAWVAGPSIFAGKARVARLDVSAAAGPVLDLVADVEGVYEDFAFDGAGKAFLAVQVPGDWGAQVGSVLEEGAGGLVVEDVHRVTGLFRCEASFVHASGGWLFAGYAPWTKDYHSSTSDQLAIFRLP